jgi:hypothetical protein
MIRLILAAIALLVACSSDPLVLPDPTTGASSSVGSGGMGGQGGIGGVGGEGGSGGSVSMPGDGSGTRLKRRVYTSPDGLRADVGGVLFDSALGIECYPTTVPSGETRCMPSVGATGFPIYEDALCTVRAVTVNSPCGDASPAYTTVGPPVQGCNDPPAGPPVWHHVGPKMSGVPMYFLSGGACMAFPLSGYLFFKLGPELDYSQYAPMSLSVE